MINEINVPTHTHATCLLSHCQFLAISGDVEFCNKNWRGRDHGSMVVSLACRRCLTEAKRWPQGLIFIRLETCGRCLSGVDPWQGANAKTHAEQSKSAWRTFQQSTEYQFIQLLPVRRGVIRRIVQALENRAKVKMIYLAKCRIAWKFDRHRCPTWAMKAPRRALSNSGGYSDLRFPKISSSSMSSWFASRFRGEGIIFVKGSCIIKPSIFYDSMILVLLIVYAFFWP